MRYAPAALSTFGLLALSSATARADIAPGPSYVESCTIAKQAKAGEECLDCSAYYGNPDHCKTQLATYTFAQRCRARGASVWQEVWCRAKDGNAKPVPPNVLASLSNPSGAAPPTPSGAPDTPATPSTSQPTPGVQKSGGACASCAIVGRSSDSSRFGWVGLLGLVLIARRRRR